MRLHSGWRLTALHRRGLLWVDGLCRRTGTGVLPDDGDRASVDDDGRSGLSTNDLTRLCDDAARLSDDLLVLVDLDHLALQVPIPPYGVDIVDGLGEDDGGNAHC